MRTSRVRAPSNLLRRSLYLLIASAACAVLGCQSGPAKVGVSDPLLPSHQRDWNPALAVLPTAEILGDEIHVRNIRNSYYFSEDVYTPRYYDKTFSLNELKTVDFVVVPFQEAPSLAHTMLTFGFEGEQYLGVSVEARLEKDEVYSPLKGALRQFELMYVVADERDLIQLRTEHRNSDVYIYRTQVTPEQARALFVDMMERVNQIAKTPEFYDTLTNNCTTNIVQHVNRVRPGRIPFDIGVVLSGHSDRLAYDLGLIDQSKPFEETRRAARINDLARQYKDDPAFSERIRR